MRVRDRRPLALLAVAGALLLGLLVLVAGAGALLAAPLLALVVPLLAGRYLGEERIERLVAARTAPVQPTARAASAQPALRAPLVLVPRGGRLLATALAVRPPPLSAQLT